jgi:hypothetical protein
MRNSKKNKFTRREGMKAISKDNGRPKGGIRQRHKKSSLASTSVAANGRADSRFELIEDNSLENTVYLLMGESVRFLEYDPTQGRDQIRDAVEKLRATGYEGAIIFLPIRSSFQ